MVPAVDGVTQRAKQPGLSDQQEHPGAITSKERGRVTGQEQNNTFRTRDLPLAAFLALHDIRYARMERQGKHGFWVYDRDDHLDQLLAIFENGEVTIDLRDFMDCVSKVRSELYAYLGVG